MLKVGGGRHVLHSRCGISLDFVLAFTQDYFLDLMYHFPYSYMYAFFVWRTLQLASMSSPYFFVASDVRKIPDGLIGGDARVFPRMLLGAVVH